jgi:hypothetical protein
MNNLAFINSKYNSIVEYFADTFFPSKQLNLGIEAKKAIFLGFIQFGIVGLFELTILILLGLYVGPSINGSQSVKPSFVLIHVILLIYGQLFLCYLIFNAAVNRNYIQVVGTVAFNLFLLGYSIFQLYELYELALGLVVVPKQSDIKYVKLCIPFGYLILSLMTLFVIIGCFHAYEAFKGIALCCKLFRIRLA